MKSALTWITESAVSAVVLSNSMLNQVHALTLTNVSTMFALLMQHVPTLMVVSTVHVILVSPVVVSNVPVTKDLKAMVFHFVSEMNALMPLIIAVPTVSVPILTSASLAHVLKASGATRTVNSVLIAKQTKLLPIYQAKPEMPLTLTPKSSLMTKNHSRPKRPAEMLPKCSRTLLVKLTARTRRVKHVL